MTQYITKDAHKKIAKALNDYLADAMVVYFKTHTFHWNVEGAHFYSLHLMFEKFYEEIWESLDEIAERTRALGGKTPPNLASLLKLSSVKESGETLESKKMLAILHKDFLDLSKKTH